MSTVYALIFVRLTFHGFVDFQLYAKLYTCENLDRTLVQWQNMAVCKYKKNAKITKSQDLQRFHLSKTKVYIV